MICKSAVDFRAAVLTSGVIEGHLLPFNSSLACQWVHTSVLQGFNKNTMDNFDSFSASEKAEASELQRLIAIEQQKAQFQAQVHSFTDVCWDKCVDTPGSKLDYRTETCLVSCVERFIDTTLTITNRFTQMVQKGAH